MLHSSPFPFDGVVEKSFVSQGSAVEASDPVVKLCKLSPAKIIVNMHEVLTGLISVANQFKVYPSGNFPPSAAWLDPKGIFADHIVLFVENELLPKNKLTSQEKELPKISYMFPIIIHHETSQNSMWIPQKAIIKENDNSFIWVAVDQFAVSLQEPPKRCFKVQKIAIKPIDKIIESNIVAYQAIEYNAMLKPFQMVIAPPHSKLEDGKMVVQQEYRRKYRPAEKVWVAIPSLSGLVYSVPAKAIQKHDEHYYVYTVCEKLTAIPIEVNVYDSSKPLSAVIGVGLKPELKLLLPRPGDLLLPGDAIVLGKEVSDRAIKAHRSYNKYK